jgi:hypothetical protein
MEIAQWKNSNQRNQNRAFVWRKRHLAYRESATLSMKRSLGVELRVPGSL